MNFEIISPDFLSAAVSTKNFHSPNQLLDSWVGDNSFFCSTLRALFLDLFLFGAFATDKASTLGTRVSVDGDTEANYTIKVIFI